MNRTNLGIFVSGQDLIHTFLAQQVVLQVVRILTGASRWSSVHPFQLLCSLLPGLFFLKSLELLQLPFLFLFLSQLIQFLLFLELKEGMRFNKEYCMPDIPLSFPPATPALDSSTGADARTSSCSSLLHPFCCLGAFKG